ncbi:transmembrane channel-like protein 5 isoform X2 [Salmo salar]|uniref:Transmembrane channel-like protein n=1 Tax=Salmo salar TaxID=8030 RepID=A0ABM3EX15_SALSA|nr:transmembrane channel-like protein 5 isoform X2 [Salmo salar]
MSRFTSAFIASPYRSDQAPKPIDKRWRRPPEGPVVPQDVERGLGAWSKDQGPPSSDPPLPPQPRGPKRQLGQSSPGPRVPMDTATRYRMTSRQQTGTAILVRGCSRQSPLPLQGTAVGRLGLSEEEAKEQMENDTVELVRELVTMPSRDRVKAVRGLPVSLGERRNIRCRVLAGKFSSLERTSCTDCWEQISLSVRRCSSVVFLRQSLSLWHGSLREISGRFGSAVLCYFLFLRWLLLFNLLSSLLNLSFITLPWALLGTDTQGAGATAGFRGLELLTGVGWFNVSMLYYGVYSSNSVLSGDQSSYNIQLAYLFTITSYMLLCGASVIYSLAGCLQTGVVASGGAAQRPGSLSGRGDDYWRLLCSWDFSLLHHADIHTHRTDLLEQLKESLRESRVERELSVSDKMRACLVRLAVWLLSVCLATGACVAVYYLCQHNMQSVVASPSPDDVLSEAWSLLLPVAVCVLNTFISLPYTHTHRLERYDNPRTRVYVTVLRNAMLKVSILAVLCYYWLALVPSNVPCWESYVGQDVYRLVIVDFIFCLLGSFCGEYLYKIGVYFSPLLPVVQLIKLFLIFHLKKTSIRSCHPPSSWSRVGQMQTLFISLLFLPCYLGTLALLAYTLWSLPPSGVCGPFQGQGWVMQTVDQWIASLQASQPHSAWLAWIINVILHSQVFYCLLTLIVLVVMYFLWKVTQGRKLLIMSLREQIVNEGKDKTFLLRKLQCLQRQGAGRPRPQVHFEEEREERPTRPESGQLREEARPPPSFQHPPPPMEAPSLFNRPPWDSSPRLGRGQTPSPRGGASPRGSPGRGRTPASRQECWVEEEQPAPPPPDPLWPVRGRGWLQGRPHGGPRLEPLPARVVPVLPGSVPESAPPPPWRPGSSRAGVNQGQHQS